MSDQPKNEETISREPIPGQDNMLYPSKELELTMALKRYEFERYIRRLDKVPSPPIALMFALATLFAGGAFGFCAAALVVGLSTTTAEAGTGAVLWVITAALTLLALVCLACGLMLRSARVDQLHEIVDEMKLTLKAYPWEKGE
jgi:hypothetical protein